MKENIQFILTLCLFAYIIFLQQCKQSDHSSNELPKIDTIIRMDTTFPAPIIVQMPRQEVPAPTIIYIDSSRNVIANHAVDTSLHLVANLYQDSIQDENLTLYYNSIVEGQLLQNTLNYKLKVPKFITKTVEITKPYPVPVSAFFLTAGIGGNPGQSTSVTAGLQFVSAKGWALGYDYDILQNSHHVKLGVKLFQIKPKIK